MIVKRSPIEAAKGVANISGSCPIDLTQTTNRVNPTAIRGLLRQVEIMAAATTTNTSDILLRDIIHAKTPATAAATMPLACSNATAPREKLMICGHVLSIPLCANVEMRLARDVSREPFLYNSRITLNKIKVTPVHKYTHKFSNTGAKINKEGLVENESYDES